MQIFFTLLVAAFSSVCLAETVTVAAPPDYAIVRFKMAIDVEGPTEGAVKALVAESVLEDYRKVFLDHTGNAPVVDMRDRDNVPALSSEGGLVHSLRFAEKLKRNKLANGNWECVGTLEIGMTTDDFEFVDLLKESTKNANVSRNLSVTYALSLEDAYKLKIKARTEALRVFRAANP